MKKYSFFNVMKKCVNEAWKAEKSLFIWFVVYTVFASFLALAGIFIPRIIIEEIQKANIVFSNLLILIGGLSLAIALISFFDRYINNTVYVKIMAVRIQLLTNIFNKLNRLDYHYTENPNFLNENTDALNSIGRNDYEEVIARLFGMGTKILLTGAYGYFIVQLSPFVLLGLLVSIAFGVISSFIVKNYQFKRKQDLTKANRRIRYYEDTMADFGFGKDIRVYNFQNKIKENYDFEILSYVSVFRKIRNKEYFLGLLELIFVLISDALLYYFLITRVFDGLNIAMFSFYLLIALSLSTILKSAVEDIVFLAEKGQMLNDYFYFMEKEYNEKGEGIKSIDGDTLEIEFKNVSFKYPNTDKWIIKDLNLKIKAGEKLAIVGVNGAGKTTLVKLLLRLFNPTEGQILVNGIDARDYDKEFYQSLFSPVFQDINILAFSVRENITLGHSNDEERIWKCLELVGLKEKIEKLENGLDTNLLKNIDEKGIVLSGGENQKLTIARALYKNGKMVVLDEPTAALDALAEAEIYENFSKLVKDKTTIFISHRLASTKFCDKIALFNNNTLQEYGTHDELMNLKKEYYNMFVIQGKYYQKGEDHEN